MLFNSARDKCILAVLRLLSIKDLTYSQLFRETKVSHITLQKALKDMLEHRLIWKLDSPNFRKDYDITDKGLLFLKKLEEIDKY